MLGCHLEANDYMKATRCAVEQITTISVIEENNCCTKKNKKTKIVCLVQCTLEIAFVSVMIYSQENL